MIRNTIAILAGTLTLGVHGAIVGESVAEPDPGCWYPWSHAAHGWTTMVGRYSLETFSAPVLQRWQIDPSRKAIMVICDPALRELDQRLLAKNEDMLYLIFANEEGSIAYRWNPQQLWIDKKNYFDRRIVSLARNYDVHNSKPFAQHYEEKVRRDLKSPVLTLRDLSRYNQQAWVPQLKHVTAWNWRKATASVPPYSAEPVMYTDHDFSIRLSKYQAPLIGGSDLYSVDVEWEDLDEWLNPTGRFDCNKFYFWMDYWSTIQLSSRELLGLVDRDVKFHQFNARNETLGYDVWVDKFLQPN